MGMTESPVLSSLSMKKFCGLFPPPWSISLLYYKTVELEKELRFVAIRGRSWLRGNHMKAIKMYKLPGISKY